MSKLTNQAYLKNEQYNDAAKLNARIQIHKFFSTNTTGWYPWLLEQINLPENACILELGCGSGEFWLANHGKIPAEWQVTLSDFSSGMLEQARQNLSAGYPAFTFKVIDAQSIPYPDASFDAVFANHMLYHVPDRPKALAEIRRVLAPGGQLYASTVGEQHMVEEPQLTARFDPTLAQEVWARLPGFTLESGQSQLEEFFSNTRIVRYPDSLHVTKAEPLADYMLSTTRLGGQHERRPELVAWLERELAERGGAIDITKDSGVFIARKSA